MKQNELEIQRFLQIREEIREEIQKIEPSIALLQETTKRFIAHFDVFQKLSQNAQEQIKAAIKGTSQEMAELVGAQVCSKIENQLHREISKLNDSVQNARKTLGIVERKDKIKTILISVLGMLVIAMGSFGGGYFYNKKTTYSLSKEVLETYALGENFQKVWQKLSSKEK